MQNTLADQLGPQGFARACTERRVDYKRAINDQRVIDALGKDDKQALYAAIEAQPRKSHAPIFNLLNFECLTALLSVDKVGPTVARIAQDSRWMEVTPSPNDLFEVTVKNEAGARELFPAGVPLAVHQRSAAAEFCEAEERPVEARKLYRTTVTYEVLSEEESAADWPFSTIAHECDQGSCSGFVRSVNVEQLTQEEMIAALISHGSDAGFFQLGDDQKPATDRQAVA